MRDFHKRVRMTELAMQDWGEEIEATGSQPTDLGHARSPFEACRTRIPHQLLRSSGATATQRVGHALLHEGLHQPVHGTKEGQAY